MSPAEHLNAIARAISVTVDEILASRADNYTYMPGACITCGAVYEDVHCDRAGRCAGCKTVTVWPWTAIADEKAPASTAVRQTCYRAPARLEALP